MAGIRATRRPVRLDSYEGVAGPIAEWFRDAGIAGSVGAPVIVSGTLWGALEVSGQTPLAPGADARVAQFSELVAVALANADAREQLAASRARIVEAGDAERRRLERNLHDGAQQRLVSLSLALRLARERVRSDPAAAEAILAGASLELAQALEELRELARGIHPAMLTDRGLHHALEVLATRSPVPVALTVGEERLPAPVEAARYYVASEALANVVKHANASRVEVRVTHTTAAAAVEITDDGLGGADTGGGSGLRGLADRVEALGGRLTVRSPGGGGTSVRGEVPLRPQRPAAHSAPSAPLAGEAG
jgi:signal transduction histidine kinase